jgi:hypothetical protein
MVSGTRRILVGINSVVNGMGTRGKTPSCCWIGRLKLCLWRIQKHPWLCHWLECLDRMHPVWTINFGDTCLLSCNCGPWWKYRVWNEPFLLDIESKTAIRNVTCQTLDTTASSLEYHGNKDCVDKVKDVWWATFRGRPNTVVSSNLWKLRIYFDCYSKKDLRHFHGVKKTMVATVRVGHDVASS